MEGSKMRKRRVRTWLKGNPNENVVHHPLKNTDSLC